MNKSKSDKGSSNFSFSLITEQSPEKIFEAIKNVRAWWSGYYSEEIEGNTSNPGDEFTFSAGEGAHFTKHKIVEVIQEEKMVWLTTESNLSFVEVTDEWTGTRIIFEIKKEGNKHRLTFTHEGLNPEFQCYTACAPSWTAYLENKLIPLINDKNSN